MQVIGANVRGCSAFIALLSTTYEESEWWVRWQGRWCVLRQTVYKTEFVQSQRVRKRDCVFVCSMSVFRVCMCVFHACICEDVCVVYG